MRVAGRQRLAVHSQFRPDEVLALPLERPLPPEARGGWAAGFFSLLSVRVWVFLIVLLTILGLVLDAPAMLTLVAFLTVAVTIGWSWSRAALKGVRYRRTFSQQRVFPGERVEVAVHVSNAKLLPLTWLIAHDLWPEEAVLEQGGEFLPYVFGQGGRGLLNTYSLKWRERVTRRYTLRCVRRGIYPFGPVSLRSGDPFGLFREERMDERKDRLIVYPLIFSLDELGLPPKGPLGDVHTRETLFADPARTVGVRDYRPGDSPRHVHWKATARRQALQTRVYEPTTTLTTVFFLDVATRPEYWLGADPARLEWAVSVTASLANEGFTRRQAVGLVSNGVIFQSDQPLRVPPGRSTDRLVLILESLAAVTGNALHPIEAMLLTESARLRWGATLVVVTTLVSEPLLVTMSQLKEAGRRVALVALGKQPLAAPDGVPAVCLPTPPPGLLPLPKRVVMRWDD